MCGERSLSHDSPRLIESGSLYFAGVREECHEMKKDILTGYMYVLTSERIQIYSVFVEAK